LGGAGGLRYSGLKVGISGTHEKLNAFSIFGRFFASPASRFAEMPLNRFGADLSYYWKDFTIEGEYISASIDREFAPGVKVNADFYYFTIGYYVTEKLFTYGLWSQLDITDFGINIDQINPPADTVFSVFNSRTKVDLPSIGLAYTMNDRIVFKGQIMFVDIDLERSRINDNIIFERASHNLDRYALAVSVFF